MADIAPDINGKVAADGTRQRGDRVSLTQQLATSLDDLLALPHHADDGARTHVADETGEEGLLFQVGVVILEKLGRRVGDLDGQELVTLLLEALDDFADQAAFNAVRLDLE